MIFGPFVALSSEPGRADARSCSSAARAAVVLLVSGCAVGTDSLNALTPEQTASQMSGRSMAANDTITPGSGFGLDGLAYALSQLTQKCHQQQAQLLTGRKRDVTFHDRRKELRPISLAVTEIVICSQGTTALWGVNVELVEPEFLVAKAFGSGINYYAKVRTTFVPGAVITANREGIERSRIAAETARRADEVARQDQLAECRRREEELSKSLQAKPQVGMRVALGLIVEVKHPLALIQYDGNGQALRGRQQEWVLVSTLRAREDCPP